MASETFSYGDTLSAQGAYDVGNGLGSSWSNLINGEGTLLQSSSYPYPLGIQAKGSGHDDEWAVLFRMLFFVDTSSLPDSCTISSATLKIKAGYKSNVPNWANLKVNTVQLTDTPTGTGDFVLIGNTEICDTAITYDNWDTSDWNEFSLNSTGLAIISKTGYTYIGLKEITYDKGASPPTWGADYEAYIIPTEGTGGFDAELVINYTTVAFIPKVFIF